jgi:ABC-type sulfate/molybdate transport systems ATPase subunit
MRASTLVDRLVVLEDGRTTQIGTPEDIRTGLGFVQGGGGSHRPLVR